MQIHNYTPHDINIYANGECIDTLKSEGLARCEQNETLYHCIGWAGSSIPVKKFNYGDITGLPENINNDDYFIVSSIVAQAAVKTNHPLKDRLYIVADTVRNEKNQIIGCQSLALYE